MWIQWVVSAQGDVNVVFYDRRLDTTSSTSEWPASRQRPGNYLTWFWGAQCTVTIPDSRECVAAETAVTAPRAVHLAAQPGVTAQAAAQPLAQTDARAAGTPVGAQAPTPHSAGPGRPQYEGGASFPFRNFTISHTPSNMDYAFRNGVFIGDYNNVAIGPDQRAYGFWTDARNGRSSREQAGRNPSCEHADVFVDEFDARNGGAPDTAKPTDELFLATPCSAQVVDMGRPAR